MTAIPPGSFTAWNRVVSNTGDDRAWDDFFRRYWPVVHDWARACLGNPQAAEEVATDVFERLFRRITNPGLDPVQPDAEGSFRPYIHTIVIHLCKDYHTNPHRMRMLGLTEAGVVCLEDPKSIEDLGDKLARREAMDLLMERFGALFVAAIRDLKASPHFDPRSLQIFFRVHRDGKRPTDVDAEFGHATPGLASKNANRVRDRLIGLIKARLEAEAGETEGLPVDVEVVFDELVRHHESPRE